MKTGKKKYRLALSMRGLWVSCVLFFCVAGRAQKSVRVDTVNKPYSVKLHYYPEKKPVTIKEVSKIDTTAFTPGLKKDPGPEFRTGVHFALSLRKKFF